MFGSWWPSANDSGVTIYCWARLQCGGESTIWVQGVPGDWHGKKFKDAKLEYFTPIVIDLLGRLPKEQRDRWVSELDPEDPIFRRLAPWVLVISSDPMPYVELKYTTSELSEEASIQFLDTFLLIDINGDHIDERITAFNKASIELFSFSDGRRKRYPIAVFEKNVYRIYWPTPRPPPADIIERAR